jgi:hypothetical protein
MREPDEREGHRDEEGRAEERSSNQPVLDGAAVDALLPRVDGHSARTRPDQGERGREEGEVVEEDR